MVAHTPWGCTRHTFGNLFTAYGWLQLQFLSMVWRTNCQYKQWKSERTKRDGWTKSSIWWEANSVSARQHPHYLSSDCWLQAWFAKALIVFILNRHTDKENKLRCVHVEHIVFPVVQGCCGTCHPVMLWRCQSFRMLWLFWPTVSLSPTLTGTLPLITTMTGSSTSIPPRCCVMPQAASGKSSTPTGTNPWFNRFNIKINVRIQ